jgi:HSP20 family protein
MATQRQTGQQSEHREQRSTNQPMEGGAGEATRGRQGTGVARSGEYQRGGRMPTLFSDFDQGPFAMMRRLSDEMDRLFEGFGMGRGPMPSWGRGAMGGGETASLWTPRVEMCERGDKLVVSVDLPGVKKDDVTVEMEPDAITIQGERRQETSGSERGYYTSERSYGSFYRQIPLPDGVDAESASATFRDGVLEIEMDAPRQASKGRKLEIREGGATGTTMQGESGSTTTGKSTH